MTDDLLQRPESEQLTEVLGKVRDFGTRELVPQFDRCRVPVEGVVNGPGLGCSRSRYASRILVASTALGIGHATNTKDDDLASVTDEEVLELIDRELSA